MNARACGRSATSFGLGILLAGWPGFLSANEPPVYSKSVIAENLSSPDGLALHPVSGELYVSEETASRVSVIRNGRAVPVITSFTVDGKLPDWLITPDRPRASWLTGQLKSPEGIAFAPDGSLYVVEDTPGGRVLQFTPDAAGRFTQARVVPVPWLDEPYAWESLCIGAAGELYLAGSSQEARPGWGSSCVLGRDPSNDWWVVDYGPFAGFSAVDVAQAEKVLIAGDESVGTVTLWDVGRRQELTTIGHEFGTIEGLCLLADGSIAVAQETGPPDARSSGGRVSRLDPSDGKISLLADGLSQLESVVCDKKTGRIFMTEDGKGRILCLTPDVPSKPGHELMKLAQRSGAARRGITAHAAPGFLKDLLNRVGVQLVDEQSDKTGAHQQMTLEELGEHIPLVAGRVKVKEMPGVVDPITEVRFINLFPNQVTMSGQSPTPSLCLFSARHSSGKVDRSQPLMGFHANKRTADGEWKTISRDAFLMLPLTTCSASESENGMAVSMSFLGLDRFGDSFLTINYGRSNEAYFSVSGEKLVVAPATFTEMSTNGEEVINFAMAGVKPRRAEDSLWLKIGDKSRWSLVAPGLEIWISRWTKAQLPDLVDRLRLFNREVLASYSEPPEPDQSLATREPKRAGEAAPVPPNLRDVAPPRQADLRPPRKTPPVAAIKFPKPSTASDDSNVATNLLIGRLTEAWQEKSVE